MTTQTKAIDFASMDPAQCLSILGDLIMLRDTARVDVTLLDQQLEGLRGQREAKRKFLRERDADLRAWGRRAHGLNLTWKALTNPVRGTIADLRKPDGTAYSAGAQRNMLSAFKLWYTDGVKSVLDWNPAQTAKRAEAKAAAQAAADAPIVTPAAQTPAGTNAVNQAPAPELRTPKASAAESIELSIGVGVNASQAAAAMRTYALKRTGDDWASLASVLAAFLAIDADAASKVKSKKAA